MLDLAGRNVPDVAALPTASAALAGTIFRLTTNDNAYWCDGSAWFELNIRVGTTAPTSPQTNDLWVDTT